MAAAKNPFTGVKFDGWPRTRALIVRVVGPGAIKLLIGAFLGELAANPTVVRQYANFLSSVEMYSQYRDLDRAQWPFWVDMKWYLAHYMGDRLTVILLWAGTLTILILRDRKAMPFLAAAWLFFVSKVAHAGRIRPSRGALAALLPDRGCLPGGQTVGVGFQ